MEPVESMMSMVSSIVLEKQNQSWLNLFEFVLFTTCPTLRMILSTSLKNTFAC